MRGLSGGGKCGERKKVLGYLRVVNYLWWWVMHMDDVLNQVWHGQMSNAKMPKSIPGKRAKFVQGWSQAC